MSNVGDEGMKRRPSTFTKMVNVIKSVTEILEQIGQEGQWV